MKTITDWLKEAEKRLAPSPDARCDAAWICEELLALPRSRQRLEGDRVLTEAENTGLENALERRLNGEPLGYIFGHAPFMGFEFAVDPSVLIPRMDTETLCEQALLFLKHRKQANVLDLCAGSGCIGLSLKRLCPQISLTLSDISPGASAIQCRNAAGLEGVRILTGDLFTPVREERFDLIVCNPPYISSGEIPSLDREVLREPRLALDGGPDGLCFYRRLAEEAPRHLLPGGALMLEIGYDQAETAGMLFPTPLLIRDLCEQPRVLIIQEEAFHVQ